MNKYNLTPYLDHIDNITIDAVPTLEQGCDFLKKDEFVKESQIKLRMISFSRSGQFFQNENLHDFKDKDSISCPKDYWLCPEAFIGQKHKIIICKPDWLASKPEIEPFILSLFKNLLYTYEVEDYEFLDHGYTKQAFLTKLEVLTKFLATLNNSTKKSKSEADAKKYTSHALYFLNGLTDEIPEEDYFMLSGIFQAGRNWQRLEDARLGIYGASKIGAQMNVRNTHTPYASLPKHEKLILLTYAENPSLSPTKIIKKLIDQGRLKNTSKLSISNSRCELKTESGESINSSKLVSRIKDTLIKNYDKGYYPEATPRTGFSE